MRGGRGRGWGRRGVRWRGGMMGDKGREVKGWGYGGWGGEKEGDGG